MKRHLAVLAIALTLATVPVVAVAEQASAANTSYYISNLNGANCSDSGPATAAQPWCTFAPVNAHGAFGPGDQILLARGAVWTQTMHLTGTGTAAQPIKVSAWGSGANPSIQGSGSVNDRGIKLVNGDHWSFSHLQISHVASGILAYYDTKSHQGLSFDDIYVHHVKGLMFYKDEAGNDVASAYADNVRNSAGIQITGKYTTFSASEYFVKGVRIRKVTGNNNFVTVGMNMISPADKLAANIGGSGGNGNNLIQDVVIDGVVTSDNNWGCDEAMTIVSARNLVIKNSVFNNSAPCHHPNGNTVILLGRLQNASIVNSIFTNVASTGSHDENALDYEFFVDEVRARNLLIANTPGSAVSFLKLGGRPGDHSTNSEVSSNVFANNGVVKGSGPLLVLDTTGTPPSGVIKDNINVNQLSYTNQGGGFGGFTTINNRMITSGSGSVTYAANDYGSVQGGEDWSYQWFNGSAYANLTWDESKKLWTPSGQSTPVISQFEQHPGPDSSAWSARAWTAPVAGNVSVRGLILKSDNAGLGDGVLARITKNGTVIWPASGAQLIAAADEYTGVSHVLDDISVSQGDVIRFEINQNGNPTYDSVSWVPTVAYTSSPNYAFSWDFTGGAEGHWRVANATTTTATGSDPNSLNLTATTSDPQLLSPDNLHLNAASSPTILVRMTNATSSTTGRIYFTTTTETGLSESKSVPFTLLPNSGYTSYSVPMSSNPTWAGDIKFLRVDPVTATGSVKIASIVVLGTNPHTVNKIAGGGFEEPSTSNYAYAPAGAWAYSAMAGVQKSGGAFSGSQAAPEQIQTGLLQGTATASQQVNLTAGSHTVSLMAARRSNFGGANAVDVYVDGTKVTTSPFAPGTVFASFTTPPFTTTAGVHLIELRGTTPGDNTVLVDNVAVQ